MAGSSSLHQEKPSRVCRTLRWTVIGREVINPSWSRLEVLQTHTIHGTGISTYIYHKNKPNAGKYTIHGSYGKLRRLFYDASKSIKWEHHSKSVTSHFCTAFFSRIWIRSDELWCTLLWWFNEAISDQKMLYTISSRDKMCLKSTTTRVGCRMARMLTILAVFSWG